MGAQTCQEVEEMTFALELAAILGKYTPGIIGLIIGMIIFKVPEKFFKMIDRLKSKTP